MSLKTNQTKMLTKEKIEKYKKALEKNKERLLKEIEDNEKTENFGEDTDHFEKEADEAEEIGNQLAINKTLKDQISQIEIALSRIEKGEYGLCENCNKEIEEEVLEMAPESHLCLKCKKENPQLN